MNGILFARWHCAVLQKAIVHQHMALNPHGGAHLVHEYNRRVMAVLERKHSEHVEVVHFQNHDGPEHPDNPRIHPKMRYGAPEADAAEHITKQVYSNMSMPYPARGETVSMLKVHGKVVGYLYFNPAQRYVADFAVLPEHRSHARHLLKTLLAHVNKGGTWEATARLDTSLPLLRHLKAAGLIEMEEHGDKAEAVHGKAGKDVYFWAPGKRGMTPDEAIAMRMAQGWRAIEPYGKAVGRIAHPIRADGTVDTTTRYKITVGYGGGSYGGHNMDTGEGTSDLETRDLVYARDDEKKTA